MHFLNNIFKDIIALQKDFDVQEACCKKQNNLLLHDTFFFFYSFQKYNNIKKQIIICYFLTLSRLVLLKSFYQ